MSQQIDEKSNIKYNVYNRLISGLHRFFASIKDNFLLFIISIVITTSCLFYINNTQKDLYKLSFTVGYDDLVRKIYGDRLEKVNDLIVDDNYSKVSRLLGVSGNVAKTLVKVKGTNILGQDLSEDMNTDRIPFIVTITVTDSSKINELQHGLVNFLEEGNEYMAVKKEVKIKEVLEELEFIDRQLRMMDSLKKKYNDNSYAISDVKTNYTNSSANTIYQFSYELYKRKQELERKKSMPANVQILDDAIAPKSLQKPAVLLIILGIFSGFILYVFLKYFLLPVFRGRL